MPRSHRLRAPAQLLTLAFILLASAGCAGVFAGYDVAPNGLSRRDDNLRRLLISGEPDSALSRVGTRRESAPEDELLRALYRGTLAHYAGSFDLSSAALERAGDLADDRYTKRVSRAALSLVTSDMALPYEPGGAERLLIHYYSALNYLHQGDLEGATVEARRLGNLLERDWAVRDTALHGWLRYLSGTIFEAAGEWNDAGVAYRNAEHLLGPAAVRPVSGTATGTVSSDHPETTDDLADNGEVVILVEEGFVAHRVEQSIVLPLYDFEMSRLRKGRTSDRLVAAGSIATRVLAHTLAEVTGQGPITYYEGRPRPLYISPLPREAVPGKASELRAPYILRVAWPVYRQERRRPHDLRVVADAAEALTLRTNLTTAVIRDFADERAGILARTILRGVTKTSVTLGLESLPDEDDAYWGRILGMIFNLGSAILEQADTRSWQLLPEEIRLMRVSLPPGEHEIALEVTGTGGGHRRIELGSVTVEPGKVHFLSTRIW